MAKIIQEVFPCGLNKYDIYFLSRRLNLSKPKTVLLTEEETDLNLLLLQICSLPLTKRQTRNLSDLLLIKILIFKYGKRKKLQSEDLIEFSKIVCHSYEKIITGNIYLKELKKDKPSLEHSATTLVMFGLFSDYFHDYVHPKDMHSVFKNNYDFIKKGLDDVKFSDTSTVLDNGLDILNEIKEEEWLKETKIES